MADIASPAERGTYVSVVSFASVAIRYLEVPRHNTDIIDSSTVAPTFGPILGGVITYAADWPWIFWFLCITSGTTLAFMVVLLPETSRNIVGNGSIPPTKALQLPVKGVFAHWNATGVNDLPRKRLPNPLRSLVILARKDNVGIILACGLLYVVYTCINASLSTLFVEIYGLNQWEAGLIYLPFGLGGVASTLFTGKLLNSAYHRARTKRGLDTDVTAGDNLDNFPIEKARLSVMWLPLILTGVSVTAFGWTLHFHTVSCMSSTTVYSLISAQHLAIPLSMQFVAGLCMQLDFSVGLLIYHNPPSPLSADSRADIQRTSCGQEHPRASCGAVFE